MLVPRLDVECEPEVPVLWLELEWELIELFELAFAEELPLG